MAGRRDVVKPGAAQWALALACVLLWVVKFWLVWRLNINWDEFFYLSQVHGAARGELNQALQTAFTHLFLWLPRIEGDEIVQIHAARVLMVVLLGASALLIQRLAARWFPPMAAWAAALAFLALWPTMKHGGSFRADSLLLPLQLGALVVLTHPRLGDRGQGLGAGLLLGLAAAVSVKVVLLAPVVAVVGWGEHRDWRRGLMRMAWLTGAAVVTAAVVIGAHLLTVTGQDASGAMGTMARGAWKKTVHDTPWFPQPGTLREMLVEDGAFWMVAAAGLSWALWRRLWLVAACALALLPIVFYRNSFAYYYVVMAGPAAVTIAAAVAGLHDLVIRVVRPGFANAVALALVALLGAQGLRDLHFLAQPRQEAQRQLISAVHTIFPNPVPYIDHSGMIASFRKANFFMSTWGVENYVARNSPFMPAAIARYQPPLLIGNRFELVPGTGNYGMLLERDRQIIETQYQPYWGPIRVAGASALIDGRGPVPMELPFAGRYRLESPMAAWIDGVLVRPGEAIVVGRDRLVVEVTANPEEAFDEQKAVRLLWADAQPPPASPPVSLNYYDGL